MRFLQFFPTFIKTLFIRMGRGFEDYGDVSFDRPLAELLGELEEEIYDIFGWGFIMLAKIQGMKEKIKRLREKNSST